MNRPPFAALFHVKHRPESLSTVQALTPDEFRAMIGTEAATLERLGVYLRLLETWQPRINLVSRASLGDPWRRHMLDSTQLVPLLPEKASLIADIGSGAGFPGLVVAILTGRTVDLIDSDARKCAFLREAGRLTNCLLYTSPSPRD